MASSTMFVGTDGTISLTGLTLQPAGTIVTGATVTGTLFDQSGVSVTNWIAVTLVDQGAGTYSYTFVGSLVPPIQTYSFLVTAVKTGVTLVVKHEIIVAYEVV